MATVGGAEAAGRLVVRVPGRTVAETRPRRILGALTGGSTARWPGASIELQQGGRTDVLTLSGCLAVGGHFVGRPRPGDNWH